MNLPDLDSLIAEVDRTCGAANRRDEVEQPDWIALLTTAADLAGRLQALADDLVEDYVEHCRLHGCSWAEIGVALGVTRQAAQQRFLAPHKPYDPEEFAAELSQALTHVKRVAIRQRNNYIGTEHLLWGVTAEDTTATRLLTSLGASVDDLRRSLETRLTLGASQAAERIAFTPYSRKAMAIARELAAEHDPVVIGCDHLLVGLARIGRGVAATVLSEAGSDLTTVEEAFRRSRGDVGSA